MEDTRRHQAFVIFMKSRSDKLRFLKIIQKLKKRSRGNDKACLIYLCTHNFFNEEKLVNEKIVGIFLDFTHCYRSKDKISKFCLILLINRANFLSYTVELLTLFDIGGGGGA